MTKQALYSGDLSLAELEQELNRSEAILLGLVAITIQDGETLATFSDTEVVSGRLRLAINQDGLQTPARHERVVARGNAVVKRAPVKIIVFRPAGSGASAGSAPKR